MIQVATGSSSVASVLVDANVLLDVLAEDPNWLTWSATALADAASRARLVINPLVYAEVSALLASPQLLDESFPEELYRREALPWEAAFLAGKAFVDYRRRGGARRSPLPDFYIGAHALVRDYALLTRDARRYRTYFPRLTIIAPDVTGG